MLVEIEAEPGLVLGRPTELFQWSFAPGGFSYFDAAPDGQRFVFLGELELDPSTHLVLVQKFDEELKRLVPTGN